MYGYDILCGISKGTFEICTPICFVITDEIFPVKYLNSQSSTKLDVLLLPNSMSFVVSCQCHRKQNYFSLKRM